MWYTSTSGAAMKNISALNDCSIMLYVMTERWTSSRKYRDAFEGIKAAVLKLIADGKHKPRRAMTDMSVDVRNTLQTFDAGMAEGNRDNMEQMISDMTGEQLNYWEREDAEMGFGQNGDDSVHLGSLDLDLAFFPHSAGVMGGVTGMETGDADLFIQL
jgi:hypothetical protein